MYSDGFDFVVTQIHQYILSWFLLFYFDKDSKVYNTYIYVIARLCFKIIYNYSLQCIRYDIYATIYVYAILKHLLCLYFHYSMQWKITEISLNWLEKMGKGIQWRNYCIQNLFEILINQTEIRLYLPCTDWFGTKGTSV